MQEQKKTGMQDYYMFAVADQPYLKSQSVIKLIDKVLENKEISDWHFHFAVEMS